MGLIPNERAFSFDINKRALAPSLILEEFAAVTTPPSLKTDFNLAMDLSSVSRGPSSVSKIVGSPFLAGIERGWISSLNFPSRMAFIDLWFDSWANWSCISRLTLNLTDWISAVYPMW